jgi:murein DD-endopeptidase MepM/ murein hydrolase activator NlpD
MKNTCRFLLLTFFSLLASSRAFSEEIKVRINKISFDQSEVVKVQMFRKSTAPFTATFQGRSHDSFLMGKRQTVLIGLHYQLKPGTYSVTGHFSALSGRALPFYFRIRVKEKFPRLSYRPSNREPDVEKRIEEETEEKNNILRSQSFKRNKLGNFVNPISPIKINSKFGEKRCERMTKKRGVNCRYHLGVDYRAAFDKKRSVPVKIYSINSGRVILVADYLMDGKIVIIDHGNGVTSGYIHLSKILVRKGQWVKSGQVIAIAGKSGATNAIHLHFFVKMDNGRTIVDPEKLLRSLSK